jgi:hypothetical protein
MRKQLMGTQDSLFPAKNPDTGKRANHPYTAIRLITESDAVLKYLEQLNLDVYGTTTPAHVVVLPQDIYLSTLPPQTQKFHFKINELRDEKDRHLIKKLLEVNPTLCQSGVANSLVRACKDFPAARDADPLKRFDGVSCFAMALAPYAAGLLAKSEEAEKAFFGMRQQLLGKPDSLFPVTSGRRRHGPLYSAVKRITESESALTYLKSLDSDNPASVHTVPPEPQASSHAGAAASAHPTIETQSARALE